MFTRILIAVDESEPASRAAEVGGELAAETGAAVRLLHVIHPPMAFGAEGFLGGDDGADARECEADLVVLGTHNWHTLSRFFLGSTADAVVRHAPCSVLVVRPTAAHSSRADVRRDSSRALVPPVPGGGDAPG